MQRKAFHAKQIQAYTHPFSQKYKKGDPHEKIDLYKFDTSSSPQKL